ncbi:MAG: T9SS type A sorting domain-containing protein, partial [Bacteroidota bacterium]
TLVVTDGISPIAICRDITAQLNSNGELTIFPEQIDAGSSDNCGIASLNLDLQDFSCADIGSNEVQLTVFDEQGLPAVCEATVTIEQSGDLLSDFSTQSVGTSYGDAYNNACEGTFDLNTIQTTSYNYKAGYGEFTYVTLSGDFSFTVELRSLSSNGMGGLMIRESGSNDSPMAWVGKNGYNMTGWAKLNPGGRVLSKGRGRGSRTTVLTVSRSGDVITFNQGRTVLLSISMPSIGSLQVGMYLGSTDNAEAFAQFKNVSYSESDIASFNTTQLTDVMEKQSIHSEALGVWPNPSSGELNINSEAFVGNKGEIKVYSLTGKLIYAQDLGIIHQNQYQINLQTLEAGVYIVTLESAGMLAKERIIKQD